MGNCVGAAVSQSKTEKAVLIADARAERGPVATR